MTTEAFDRLTRAMSAMQDRRRALRLGAGVALAGVAGSATVGRTGVTLVSDAEAKSNKKKKKKKKCKKEGKSAFSRCVTGIDAWCSQQYASDLTNCVASYNGCCPMIKTCKQINAAQACLNQSPYQKLPTA